MLNYWGMKTGLKPTDTMANYKGEKAVVHMGGDFSSKHLMKCLFCPDEARPAMLEALCADDGPF